MKINQFKHILIESLITLFFLIFSTCVSYFFELWDLQEANIVIIYLLGVLLTARFCNHYIFGFISSVLSTFLFNYFFTIPKFTFEVNDPKYLITFAIMIITSFITTALTQRVRKIASEEAKRAQEIQAVYKLTNYLTDAEEIEEVVKITIEVISNTFSCDCAILCIDDKGEPEKQFLQKVGNEFIHRKYDSDNDIIYHLNNLQNVCFEGEEFDEYPIYGKENLLGILRMPKTVDKNFVKKNIRLLMSIIESSALAMDRLKVAIEKQKYRDESNKERYRGTLLRAISHDLRTPLTGIMGTCEVILNMTENNDPRFELTNGIYKDAQWLHSLVENILNLTRIDDGNLVLHKQLEAPEEIIANVLEIISKRAPNRDFKISIPDEFFLVPMEAKLIIQVLVNLIDNALKHTKNTDEIEIKIIKEEKYAKFIVKDKGEGISEDDLPNIFKMFYTSKVKIIDARSGVGLGLAICEAIIKAHNGKITAENNIDGGAKFTFTLPLESE